MKVKFYYGYPVSLDIDTKKPVDVYIDKFTLDPVPADSLRIIILQEPMREPLVSIVQKYRDKYTHLLTFQEDVLDSNPKARLFHFPNTWVKGYRSKQKEFSVSTVVGGKKFMEGHALRHELWRNQDKISIPKNFWLSGNVKHSHTFVPWNEVNYLGRRVLGASKEPLFDSMFHVAIENCSIANYFSEKIIDCFQTLTVPIYYGCTNIGEFFNDTGIIQVKNIEEIVRVCNQLTPEYYERILPILIDNFELSNKWCDQDEQLRNGIIQILKEENYA